MFPRTSSPLLYPHSPYSHIYPHADPSPKLERGVAQLLLRRRFAPTHLPVKLELVPTPVLFRALVCRKPCSPSTPPKSEIVAAASTLFALALQPNSLQMEVSNRYGYLVPCAFLLACVDIASTYTIPRLERLQFSKFPHCSPNNHQVVIRVVHPVSVSMKTLHPIQPIQNISFRGSESPDENPGTKIKIER